MENTTTSSDLDHFRRQWQQEVKQKTTKPPDSRSHGESSGTITLPKTRPERPVNKPPTRHPLADVREAEDRREIDPSQPSASIDSKLDSLRLEDADDDVFTSTAPTHPRNALEHFEKAVEKEAHGNLNESLAHYRKAYRLDAKVDQVYKNKHFAQQWKQTKSDPSKSTSNEPSVAGIPVEAPSSKATPTPSTAQPVATPPTSQLIASFAHEQIPNAEPLIQGDVAPPCPIRHLPTEVLLELLKHIALIDVSIYTRLASVCKKLAYHVYTEASIWKRIALGPEIGLGSQMYHFATDVHGREAIWRSLGNSNNDDEYDDDEKPMPPVTDQLFLNDQDWRETVHSYPRIRFSGVYISTVNYTRSGGAASSWGNQIHIVTYYRYLRFFRDGTCISLLTTHEPMEVVNLLSRENVSLVRSSKEPTHPLNFTSNAPALWYHEPAKGKSDAPAPPPTAQNIMKHALRGRWRLCHPSLSSIEIGSNAGAPGDLHIETEGGAGPRYMYTMHLSLKHGNTRNKHATRNNKLVWKGFWSYNSLSNDWAEFHLRNDKAFWFSRVKSYGLGY